LWEHYHRLNRVLPESPSLFNVYVNDFENYVPDHLSINTCKYVDDCTQDEVVAQETTSHMQDVLDASQKWATENKMTRKIKPKNQSYVDLF
jgi:hypothetical protein